MNYSKLMLSSLLIFLSFLSFGQNLKNKDRTASMPIVLFVCEHGAARSTIAATYFNEIAKKKGLNYKAVFRGTHPDSTISIATNKGLTEDGFNTTTLKPYLVSENDMASAAQIITFDCSVENKNSLNSPVYKWDGIPSINKNYQVARNEIVKKVEALIDDLNKKEKANK